MSTREEKIEVFRDTLKWIEENEKLGMAVMEAKRKTQVFYEYNYPEFDRSAVKEEKIEVTAERSFEAAMRLDDEKPGSKIAVMNFANAFHPGGGVASGCSAQEECLCRESTLYPLLKREGLEKSFYRHHYDMKSYKASDSLIYTEGVIVCKTDEDLPQRLSDWDWLSVDVITIAAPDLRGRSISDEELFAIHVSRAMHLLTCAAHMGADTLVLGAFGCGAFENNPEVVARAFKVALEEFPKVFDRVTFAVYCRPTDNTNFEVFKKYLG